MLKTTTPIRNHLPFRMNMKKSASKTDRRNGTATVELAVCLPVLVLLVFGGIEASHFIQLKQDLTICAYEAAKKATQSKATSAEAITRFNEIATAKGISNATITINPAVTATTATGTKVVVNVKAPANKNYDLPIDFFKGVKLKSKVVMVRQQY